MLIYVDQESNSFSENNSYDANAKMANYYSELNIYNF